LPHPSRAIGGVRNAAEGAKRSLDIASASTTTSRGRYISADSPSGSHCRRSIRRMRAAGPCRLPDVDGDRWRRRFGVGPAC
jgi:hypothetical protein